jgi:hypothetical protein
MSASIGSYLFAGFVFAAATAAVTPAIAPIAVHIGDLDAAEFTSGTGTNTAASVLVMVHDAEHRPVRYARVRGSWSDGVSGPGQCETGVDGTCNLKSRLFPDQQGLKLALAIRAIEGPEMQYDKTANHDIDGETNGSTITLYR